MNKKHFETKRQEIEVKLQQALCGGVFSADNETAVDGYSKIQVFDYFDNSDTTAIFSFCEICVNIVDDWDNREIGLVSFSDGEITEVIGQINGSTIRALQKIIKEKANE